MNTGMVIGLGAAAHASVDIPTFDLELGITTGFEGTWGGDRTVSTGNDVTLTAEVEYSTPVVIMQSTFLDWGALLFTTNSWIFIPAYCFAFP